MAWTEYTTEEIGSIKWRVDHLLTVKRAVEEIRMNAYQLGLMRFDENSEDTTFDAKELDLQFFERKLLNQFQQVFIDLAVKGVID